MGLSDQTQVGLILYTCLCDSPYCLTSISSLSHSCSNPVPPFYWVILGKVILFLTPNLPSADIYILIFLALIWCPHSAVLRTHSWKCSGDHMLFTEQTKISHIQVKRPATLSLWPIFLYFPWTPQIPTIKLIFLLETIMACKTIYILVLFFLFFGCFCCCCCFEPHLEMLRD